MIALEPRADRRFRGRGWVPIALIMGTRSDLVPGLAVEAPSFPVPRDEALALVRDHVRLRVEERDVVVHMSEAVCAPGALRLQFGEIPAHAGPRGEASWVAMIDLRPGANWEHPCVYLFVDADRAVREFRATWYPVPWRGFLRRES